MQTTWDLTQLYESLTDKRIERDVNKTLRAYKVFAKEFSTTDKWLKSPKELKRALDANSALYELPGNKALYYAYYTRELDASNKDADALLMRLDKQFTKAATELEFFTNRLSKVGKETQQKFLKSKELAGYKYFLQRLFIEGKYVLPEEQEKVLGLTSISRRELWVSGVDKQINKQEVKVGRETKPLNDALMSTGHIRATAKRRAWHRASMQKLKDISDFAESEINAIFTDKQTTDELRGYKEPYDATILSYENSPKSVLALVEVVTNNFKLVHKFYKVKQKMLGLNDMLYADRSAPVGNSTKSINFKEAASTVHEAFNDIDTKYAEIFNNLLNNGQVDVYPRLGKTGGAYCSGSVNMPTMLLLNHTDDLNSLYTLAHEMGHAIHTERSKGQNVVYQGYSTAVAETASTFFERVAFDRIFKTLSEREKVIALHNKIQDDIATVFRQVAFFNFELELHRLVRTQGWVSKEEIAAILRKHLQAYLGKSVKVEEDDGYSFVHIGHFRNFFYVYSYAFGQLISSALFNKYKADPSYIKQIDKFLSAGGSATPEQIFKDIGVDISKPEFWQLGIDEIAKDIKQLEKLAG